MIPTACLMLCLALTGDVQKITLDEKDEIWPGLGASEIRTIEMTVQGRYRVWVSSDQLDPVLLVLRASGEELRDDDSGGGTTAYLDFAAKTDETLQVVVAAKTPGSYGPVSLTILPLPETESSRALVERIGALGERFRDGDLEGWAEDLSSIEAEIDRLGPRIAELDTALWNTIVEVFRSGQRGPTTDLIDTYVSLAEATLPESHPARLQAEHNLAALLDDKGELERAMKLIAKVDAVRSRVLSPDDPSLYETRGLHAILLEKSGDIVRARQLAEDVLAAFLRLLPPGHPNRLSARTNLAVLLDNLGENDSARQLLEEALAEGLEHLPPMHPEIASVRVNLAGQLVLLGRYGEAKEHIEPVFKMQQAFLPPENPIRLTTTANYARCLMYLNRAHDAETVARRALAAARDRVAPLDGAYRQLRQALAEVLIYRGELFAAKEVLEQVLAEMRTAVPVGHESLLGLLSNLGAVLVGLGDRAGAIALFEEVYAAVEGAWPEDHPNVLSSRLNLAELLAKEGAPERATRHYDEVLAIERRGLPQDHPRLLRTQCRVAVHRLLLGESELARRELSTLLPRLEQALSSDHADVIRARRDLALAHARCGDPEAALPLLELNIALQKGRDPLGLIQSRMLQIAASAAAANSDRTLELAHRGLTEARQLLEIVTAPRERQDLVALADRVLSEVTRFVMSAEPEAASALEPELVEAIELFRTSQALEPVFSEWLAKDRKARESNEAIARAGLTVARLAAEGGDRAELFAAVDERDRLQRELRQRFAKERGDSRSEAGSDPRERLSPEEAGVVFYRVRQTAIDTGSETTYLAWVVRRGRPLARFVLGPARDVEADVEAWRQAQAPGSLAARGVVRRDTAPRPARAPGVVLFGPMLESLEGVKRVQLSLTGPLHLLPWDALEVEGQYLGDRFTFSVRSSLFEISEQSAPSSDASLLLVGGVDYGDQPSFSSGALDARRSARLEPLPATLDEIDAIAQVFEEQEGESARVVRLTGGAARRKAFASEAESARFIHVATHGWFAADSVPSVAEASASDSSLVRQSASDRIAGLAPSTLCGLAFSGVPEEEGEALAFSDRVLTAEELALLDLSGCELAVLSACETHLGLERAGEGIASLQSALRAAGVRTTVTSLWSVPDRATRDLMIELYRGLWIRGESKAEALWKAKKSLANRRDEIGNPVYALGDWAGWVLSGDPD